MRDSTAVMAMARTRMSVMAIRCKRALDIAIAASLLLASLPLLALLMTLIRLDSPGHPLFTQTRVGRRGTPYTIFKLRTLYLHQFGLFPDEEIRWGDRRVTRLGQLLRRSKLDELPQLANVMLGHMSLVGPRPDIPLQAQHYSAEDSRRLLVRPGLTGLAQISGNTWLSWSQRIRLDQWYVEHRSLKIDLLILVHTLPILLRGERATDDPLGVRRLLSAAAVIPTLLGAEGTTRNMAESM